MRPTTQAVVWFVILITQLFSLHAQGLPTSEVSNTSRPAQAVPWTAYFGSHYQKAPWADSVRDPSGPGKLAGPVSADKLSVVDRYIDDKDIILGAGGLGSGRRQESVSYFLTRMLIDYGEGWKAELKAKAKAIASMPSGTERVYWQFGNEINSQRFSQTIRAWDRGAAQDQGKGHDDSIIPFYVEYYLAPGVEALWAAADETQTERFKVILGSIASFANPRAQTFLNRLLAYRIEGLCAPGLKGKSVAEIVDVLALHYIASANTNTWRKALDTVKLNWLGRGEIEAIWSTEELGIRRAKMDAGSVFTIQVAARYLDWWLSNGLNSSQGRAFFWGADVGPEGRRGTDGMQELLQVIGEGQLRPAPQLIDIKGSNVESYSFTVQPQGTTLTMIFPGNQQQEASIRELKFKLPVPKHSANAKENKRLSAQLFSRNEVAPLGEIFDQQGKVWVMTESLDLEPMSLLLIRSD